MARKETPENQLKKVWRNHSPQWKDKDKSRISEEELYELMGNIFCPGPFYFFVFDFLQHDFVYVNRKVKEVLGYEPEKVNIRSFTERIIEEDIEHLAKCEKKAGNFFFNYLPKPLIPKYKVSYCFRIKDAHKVEKQLLHQSFVLGIDDRDTILNTLVVHSDITHLSLPLSKTISFMSLNEEPHYLGLSPEDEAFSKPGLPSPLSQREKEVLRLFAEGDNDQDISKKLHLSVHTIHTHRNNIRSKLGCRNTAQAVAIAIRNGWI
ncbi:MAG: LuxR C-terminal-related transcriptional regulator [Bacteroidota bacterium]